MEARVYAKEGLYNLARPSLKLYMKAEDKSREMDRDVVELEKDIQEGEELR
jgi:DnaJ family protein C protein 3